MLFNTTGCTGTDDNPSQVITSVPTPDFLMMVAPTRTDKRFYDTSREFTLTMARGIVVQIDGNKIGMTTENRNLLFFQQRASLVVDDQQVPQDTLRVADGLEGMGGPFYLSWAPELVPGVHEVQFQFITDAGEILEYSWQIMLEK